MHTITITGYRRPQLFERLLASLRANDLSGWQVVVRLEPTPVAQDYIAIANRMLAGVDTRIGINPERLGVRLNPLSVLQEVFARGSLVNIYLEEDMEVAPDVTRLAQWFCRHHQPNWLCLSLLAGGCGSPGLVSYPECPQVLFLAKTFNALGFVVLRREWQTHFEPAWMVDDPAVCGPTGERTIGWDWAVYSHLIRTADLQTVQPALARATHTGRGDGEHCGSEFHDLAFAEFPLADRHATDAPYRLLERDLLPPALRRHAILWHQSAQALQRLADKNRVIEALSFMRPRR